MGTRADVDTTSGKGERVSWDQLRLGFGPNTKLTDAVTQKIRLLLRRVSGEVCRDFSAEYLELERNMATVSDVLDPHSLETRAEPLPEHTRDDVDVATTKEGCSLCELSGGTAPRSEDGSEAHNAAGEGRDSAASIVRNATEIVGGSRPRGIMKSSLRLGSPQSTVFWDGLNAIAKRNTRFIMDAGLISQTFTDLKRRLREDGPDHPKVELPDVESSVFALLDSIGFKSVDEAMSYITHQPPEAKILPDQEVLSAAKCRSLPDLLEVLPIGKGVSDFMAEYQSSSPDPKYLKEFAERLAASPVAISMLENGENNEEEMGVAYAKAKKVLVEFREIRKPMIQPMNDTPIPSLSWKKFSKRLPAKYDVTPLKQRYESLLADLNAASAISDAGAKKAKEAELNKALTDLTNEMHTFTTRAVEYWESVVMTVQRMKAVEMAYQQDVELLIGGQIADANRVVGEALEYIKYLGRALASVPVLAAEGYRNEGIVRDTIRAELNACFGALTCNTEFAYFDVLLNLLSLPKNQTSVSKYLLSLDPRPQHVRSEAFESTRDEYGIPRDHVDKIAAMKSRGDQLVSMFATIVYLML